VYRHGIIRRPEEYLSPYERFVRSPPKSFFKKLFLGDSQLGYKFQKMTERNGVLRGLKDQECERGNRTNRPPIPYVPVVDEIQDAVNANSNEPRTQKIKLPNKTEFQAGVWNTGTPEEFLMHVKQAIHACDRMGLFSDYETARENRLKSKDLYDAATDDLQTAVTAGVDVTVIDDLKLVKKGHLADLKGYEKDRLDAAEGFFSLYANLLSVEARTHWDKIVDRQIGVAPWTDLKGREQRVSRTKTYKSFLDCTKHHLLTVFREDAAEQQKFYISNILKKPQRVTVRMFFTRVEQLNSFVSLLPCLYNSPRATPSTKPVVPFDEAELANLLLRMCPDSWQNQYNLNQDTIPQDSRRLLIVLENIEKLGVTTTVPMKPTANGNGNAKSNGKEPNGKRKGTDSSTGQSYKKKRTDKHCVLCQKHGGKPATHNTSDCTKYEKDGTVKPSWSSGKYLADKTKKKSDGNSYAQFEDRIFAKMDKKLKKAFKSASRQKKRRYNSDSDSDSE
jgi:hypothetical protein